jgi:hypothetical protein
VFWSATVTLAMEGVKINADLFHSWTDNWLEKRHIIVARESEFKIPENTCGK